jgi:hypothetical protein
MRSRSVFKTAVEELRPSWAEVEVARVAEGLTVKQAVKLLGLSRSSYYCQVRGMKDYQVRVRQAASAAHKEVLREVAIKRIEARPSSRAHLCAGMGQDNSGCGRD